MIEINIKPLSVNEAWKGKKFKTPKYSRFIHDCFLILPKEIEIPDGKLIAYYEFGLSSKNADNDNPVKPFQDILQKKYGFNDKMIYRTIVDKVDVSKGKEYIKFKFESYANNR